jgi:uncharacterized protein YcsI (UPF0317 family)
MKQVLLIISLLLLVPLVSALEVTNLEIQYLDENNGWISADELGINSNNQKFEIPDGEKFYATQISLEVDEKSILILDDLHSEIIGNTFSRTYPWIVQKIEVIPLPETTNINIKETPDLGLNLFATGLRVGQCVVDNYVSNLEDSFHLASFFDGGFGFSAGFNAGYNCLD